jgi:LytS/YehU family sensor histidine kinase
MNAEQMHLHIEALKNQLTPHFLFNNLNTVSGLIYSDKRLAEQYIRKFSRTCHFIMQNSANMLIRLEEEIEFVKDYFFLMQTRFPEKMELEVDLGPCHDAGFIPPLSLQLLVENAIKHNPFSGDGLLRIKIYCQDKYCLVVENNLTKSGISIAQSVKSTGIGLQNLKERFFYLTKLPVTVERGTDFKVKLPILKNKNSLYEEKFA